MADDYRVQLDIYNGPLDLLLYLIRREELDIYDIPIAKITEQYVTYVELLKQLDPNAAGEFLVLASMLMEIKSRMLLPRPPAGGQEDFEDPRLELVRQLLEYKKYKDAAEQLRLVADERLRRFARQRPEIQSQAPSEVEIDALHLWDLVEAFREVMAKTGRLAPHEIQYDDTPVALHAADMVDRLQRDGGSMAFADIFEGRTRSECIGLFLALLELVRQFRVRVEQEAPFATIFIYLLDETPIEEPVEVGLRLASSEQGPAAAAVEASDNPPPPESQAPTPAVDHAPQEAPTPISQDADDELGDMPEVPELPDLPTDRADQPPPAAVDPPTAPPSVGPGEPAEPRHPPPEIED